MGALGYVAAYELLGQPERRLDRIFAGIAPMFFVACCWLVLYATTGHGTFASGAYLDPIHEPLTFVASLPTRLLAMTGMLILGFPPDYWFLEPQTRPIAIGCGVLAVALVAPLAAIAWRSEGQSYRRHTMVLVLGAVLAMIPQTAGFLGARSLTLPSVGGSALLGVALIASWSELRGGPGRGPRRAMTWVALAAIAVTSLVVSPLSWFASSAIYSRMSMQTADNARELLFDKPQETDVITLLAPDPFFGRYFPFLRRTLGLPTPQTWRTLSIAPHTHRVTRTADNAIELEVVGGHMLGSPFETLFRRPDRPMRPGHFVDLGDFKVRVIATDDVGPTRVSFAFGRSLDDPSLAFLAWRNRRIERIEMPSVGEALVLAWVPGPTKL